MAGTNDQAPPKDVRLLTDNEMEEVAGAHPIGIAIALIIMTIMAKCNAEKANKDAK